VRTQELAALKAKAGEKASRSLRTPEHR